VVIPSINAIYGFVDDQVSSLAGKQVRYAGEGPQ